MRDIISEIWSTAQRNKLRTALTGFAVAWGIFMLIVLLGAGNGLINANEQQANRFLANSMRVYEGYTSKTYKGLKEGRWVPLRDKDLKTTKQKFSANVDEVGAVFSQGGQTMSYGQQYVSTMLTGIYPNHDKIEKREIIHGRFINEIDFREKRKTVVLSQSQAKELRPDYANLVGEFVKIGNLAYRVVGIYKNDDSEQNNATFIAFSTIKTMYGSGDRVGDLEFSFHGLETLEENLDFEERYRATINANHQAAPDDDNALWIRNLYRQNIQMQMGMRIIHTALWVVGLFTLLSGIVGVSNIMLITVKERTREFGIRKAIGAKPWSILKLIIIESVIITTFFGYIGMVLGVAANEYMDATLGHNIIDTGLFKTTLFVNPTVGLDVCFEATLVMIIAGTIAGLVPARKAARIRPIEALRAE